MTLAAHLLYMWPLLTDPHILINILSGDPGAQDISLHLKEQERVPGITSLTQLGIIYVVLFVSRLLYLPHLSFPLVERVALVAFIALALVRAIAHSERLAVIELLIPVLVLLLRRPKIPRLLLALAPVLGVIGLFAFFSVLEFFRSWQDYYQFIEDDFFSFAAQRLFGYYINALDTGAGLLNYTAGGIGPIITFQWFWSFPVNLGQDALLRGLGYDMSTAGDFIYYYTNSEFNNISGLFGPFIDYGVAGGAICWLILGLISGRLFRGYLDGSVGGLIIYPIWYTSILEVPRAFGFSGTRYFSPLLVGLGLVLWFSMSKRSAAAFR